MVNPMNEPDDEQRGHILAALTLQMATTNLLVQKGLLTWAEVKDLLDRATLSMEQEGISDQVEAHAHKLLNQLMLSIEQQIAPVEH